MRPTITNAYLVVVILLYRLYFLFYKRANFLTNDDELI